MRHFRVFFGGGGVAHPDNYEDIVFGRAKLGHAGQALAIKWAIFTILRWKSDFSAGHHHLPWYAHGINQIMWEH